MNDVRLKALLEELFLTHHRLENLAPDPLLFARGFGDPRDGEVAGLLAASFAYGRVEKILEALERVFRPLGTSPVSSLFKLGVEDTREIFQGFAYRFHKAEDLVLWFHLLRQSLDRAGSLLRLFEAHDAGPDVAPALNGFAAALLAGDARPVLRSRTVPAGHPVRFLAASPARGGAAKRLCLFLRWMVRLDAIDPGYWHGKVDPARLVVPLDTHVARVGRELGLTARSSADWRTACEITAALRRYDPRDPIRYDFSLFRYGMGASGAGALPPPGRSPKKGTPNQSPPPDSAGEPSERPERWRWIKAKKGP